MVLGRDAVRGIAAAACFDRTMARGIKGATINMRVVARHSVGTAAAAEALAQIASPSKASEAFIGGLLHNLGIALQARLDPGAVNAMIGANRDGAGGGIRTLESNHALVGHEECLAVLFEAWQVPDSLIAVAAHHHAPTNAPAPHRELTALVSLAADLALEICPGYELETVPLSRDLPAALELGLTAEHLDTVASRLPGRVDELTSALLDA